MIGEPLPAQRITKVLGSLAEAGSGRGSARRRRSDHDHRHLSQARKRRRADRRSQGDDQRHCQGLRHDRADMATMLAFVFTNASMPATVLQELLSSGMKNTFNAITVDSDTSTSDTLLPSQRARAASSDDCEISTNAWATSVKSSTMCCQSRAAGCPRRGRRTEKIIKVDVTGAEFDDTAKRIALSIANSPLVKTAIAGSDANWGRVVMAVGKAGERDADRDKSASVRQPGRGGKRHARRAL